MKNQMKDFRDKFALGDFAAAQTILAKSELKKDKKSVLLWHLENGTLDLAMNNLDGAIVNFSRSLELIDQLYTTKLASKAASLLINDASDEFYGASYERSYAHYFLSKAYYLRYLTSGNKLDLQGARGTILAWDTYFADLQRSGTKTLYTTDLMLKVFGGQVHEVSEIRNDKQISLQLYKDALNILEGQSGILSLFNKKSVEYIKSYEAEKKKPADKLYERTAAYNDLKDFLHFKILAVTREIRSTDFDNQVKALKPADEVKKKAMGPKTNVVLVMEEGFIPPKLGRPFNFGIRGAMGSVKDSGAKTFIATVGVEAVTLFAMNKLGMVPTQTASTGSFLFAHDVTRLAVQEAAIEFELPMIENVPLVQRLEVFILNDQGVVVNHLPLPVINENGDLARVVLEEDVVSRYVKTGTRVAVRHLGAIVTAMVLYQRIKGVSEGSDFLAKSAAMATYVGAAKGLSMLERADTRHWTTLPQAFRMAEVSLKPGLYKVGIASYSGDTVPKAPTKLLGDIVVNNSGKSLHTLRFNQNN
ncbi:MAG TPA: hypothetical protein VNJ08_07375 [Bacteriovoracaceae bacterium]|nr:hypothetical protein [Bacteriovoracaceae bacterium]